MVLASWLFEAISQNSCKVVAVGKVDRGGSHLLMASSWLHDLFGFSVDPLHTLGARESDASTFLPTFLGPADPDAAPTATIEATAAG